MCLNFANVVVNARGREERLDQSIPVWPLHDIATTNIVWCMAYKGEVEGGSFIAQ